MNHTPDSSSTELGRRSFAAQDQQQFAQWTGDINPMHVDAIAARRLLTGQAVVHGVHTLLAALECMPAELLPADRCFQCDFVNPVSVGDPVCFTLDQAEESSTLRATVRGLDCTRITFAPAQPVLPPSEGIPAAEGGFDALAAPVDRPPADWVGGRQRLKLPAAGGSAAFPRSSAWLGERQVAALGRLSYYVGMVCPGLHSVFSSISAQAGDDSDELVFTVQKYDPRFRLFVVTFDGSLRGSLKAFLRPASQPQPASADLLPLLQGDEFAGRAVWVLGGSRGLGELAAKLAAAGGAAVTLTYAAGADDAQRVAEDIRSSGRGSAEAVALDIVNADLTAWVRARPAPDAVLYFATPRIFRKKAGTFDGALLDEFLDFYVRRFESLCNLLEAGDRPVRLFVPSTVYIEERPRGMTEYAMAKAAAEVLCADLARTLRRVAIVSRRLPRLSTDQTTSLVAVKHGSNIDTLLPLMHELLGPSGS